MKRQLVWFYLSLAFACRCASEETTESNFEKRVNTVDDQYLEYSFTEPYDVSDIEEGSTSEEEFYDYDDEEFVTPFDNAIETPSEDIAAAAATHNPANPSMVNTPGYTPEDHWYEELIPRLKIMYTPYSALLYQEDEFGLDLLCPGYWLKVDVLLVRFECWIYNFRLDIEQVVWDADLNPDLKLAVLRLAPGFNESGDAVAHLTNIRNAMPNSLDECVLYMLQEDHELFEMYSWAKRPLAFKRAQAFLCPIDHMCLRTRPSSSAYGVDYALMCNNSLVAMLTEGRTTHERVFGRLSLTNLTLAEPWISEALKNFEDHDNKRQQ